MVASLGENAAFPQIGVKGFNLAWDDVLDDPELGALDDLPHSTRDELHLIPRVSLVVQVPLEIGEVVREGPSAMLREGVTDTDPA
jgi:hypothetical protein